MILQSDAEVFCSPGQITEAIKSARDAGWVLPFTHFYKLNQMRSSRTLKQPPTFSPSHMKFKKVKLYRHTYSVGRKRENPKITYIDNARIIGYLMAIRRDAWYGYDERFIGWGFEDVAFQISMTTLIGEQSRIEGNLYHLWHPLAARLRSIKSGQLEKNRELCLRYSQAAGNKESIRELLGQ